MGLITGDICAALRIITPDTDHDVPDLKA